MGGSPAQCAADCAATRKSRNYEDTDRRIMAKPILPKSMTPTTPAGKASAAFLVAKCREVLTYAPVAVAGDPDGVHDMRVGVKRLREALRLFRRLLPRRKRVRAMGLVEELNDTLGRGRDLDVLDGNAQWLLGQAPAAEEKLAGLREAWQEQRKIAQEDLVKLWRRLRQGERLQAEVARLALATRKRDRPLNRLPLENYAYLTIRARAVQVADRIPRLRKRTDPATLHLLRLSVKRLKYTMEPFLRAVPSLAGAYRVVTEAQEAAGLTHDLDVLEAEVTAHLRESDSLRTRVAQTALKVLRERRAELYQVCRERMEELAREDWRRALLDAMD